jgi:hypothetical protein
VTRPRNPFSAAPRGARHLLASGALGLLVAGCATTPQGEAPGSPGPGPAAADSRAAPGRRPAPTVQVQETADGTTLLYTVQPHMRAGSIASPPLVITSIGAARSRAAPDVQFRIRVETTNTNGYGGFARAETRQNLPLQLRLLQRSRDCAAAPSCPYTESLMVTVRGADLRRLAEGNAGLRFRLLGNGGTVETAIPAGHIRALLAALATPQA